MRVVPIGFAEACDFVAAHHRHHLPPQGCKFCLSVMIEDRIVGVAIVGRPVSRHLDDGLVVEITRLCTDGTRNACSKLYSACRRAAAALGYQRLITYTLPDEGGASLRASGFRLVKLAGGGNWNVPSRPRQSTAEHLQGQKWLWEAAQ